MVTEMWTQLGRLVGMAMEDSAKLWRFVVCVVVLTAAVVIILAAMP
ncbi:hypothetical protein [Nocardia salmonicida]